MPEDVYRWNLKCVALNRPEYLGYKKNVLKLFRDSAY